jgi:hypothetical protein
MSKMCFGASELPAAERLGAQDDLYRVLVELLDDACVLRAAAEGEEAEVAVQRHARRGIEHGLGLFRLLRARLEVGPVGGAEGRDVAAQHGQGLRADDVIGRGRAALRDARRLRVVREAEETRRIVAQAEHRKPGGARHVMAQLRRILALEGGGGCRRQADAPGLLRLQVLLGHRHELDHALVGLACILAEREHAVRQQHHANGAFAACFGNSRAQYAARSKPAMM